CLAGCIIARHAKNESPDKNMTAEEFGTKLYWKFNALDELRRGNVNDFLYSLYGYNDKKTSRVLAKVFGKDYVMPWHRGGVDSWDTYGSNRRAFLRRLRWIARKFKAAGY
ncbi:hypothetical protein LCGC14_2578120, partial [marine sediment metagenome]